MTAHLSPPLCEQPRMERLLQHSDAQGEGFGGIARAARGSFPYPHRTVAEIDAAAHNPTSGR